jgi:hypothetical protein
MLLAARLPLAVFAAFAALAVGGCAESITPTGHPADSCIGSGCALTVATPAAVAVGATVPTVEDQYVADILDTPGLTSTMSNDDLTGIGKSVCEAIPTVTRTQLIAAMGKTKLGPQVAEVVVSSAEKHLCPYAVYADIAGVPSAASVPASGLLTSFDDGTYEVGVDIAVGKYKTSGGANCYWARMRQPDDSSIIANDLGAGPRTVVVAKGEYFTSQRCGTWNRA